MCVFLSIRQVSQSLSISASLLSLYTFSLFSVRCSRIHYCRRCSTSSSPRSGGTWGRRWPWVTATGTAAWECRRTAARRCGSTRWRPTRYSDSQLLVKLCRCSVFGVRCSVFWISDVPGTARTQWHDVSLCSTIACLPFVLTCPLLPLPNTRWPTT